MLVEMLFFPAWHGNVCHTLQVLHMHLANTIYNFWLMILIDIMYAMQSTIQLFSLQEIILCQ